MKIVLIYGPTGVSKTKTAIELAGDIGEIISADSMQVYKGMDIGTAKASLEEQKQVPHHLLDVVNPGYLYSSQEFFDAAMEKIRQIMARNKIPFVVGGTGLYFKTLLQGGLFEGPQRNSLIREKLETLAQDKGTNHLHEKLLEVDPKSANQIHSNDKKRLIRALEVFEITSKPISEFWQQQPKKAPFHFLRIGLTMDRAQLYEKINQRCDAMLKQGLLEEVKALKEAGYSANLTSMQAIGYKHVYRYLNNEIDYDETLRLFKRDTRRYAKRQWTLFLRIEDTQWFHPRDFDQIKQTLEAFLKT